MAVVIVHAENGIYLGSFWGMGFWSKLDPVGQPSAVTFPSEEVAIEHMKTWENSASEGEGITFKNVIPDDKDGENEYASIAACVSAGLEGWCDELTPVDNSLPV